ncbi:MAG: hypothetical protein NWE92_06705 [Candidatus Bathyarchaeota archaeon]|nr:hypothetical protein [Candidatus Bathyarchaeota archaeon]
MPKRNVVLVMAITCVLLLSFANYVCADSTPPLEPIVQIQSPYQNEIFDSKEIQLNFTITESEQYANMEIKISKVEYVLDPKYDEHLMVFVGWISIPLASGSELTKNYSVNLSNIANGTHTLYVRGTASQIPSPGSSTNWYGGASTKFTVNLGLESNQTGTNNPNSTKPTSSITNNPLTEPKEMTEQQKVLLTILGVAATLIVIAITTVAFKRNKKA